MPSAFIAHPLIRADAIARRDYQVAIAAEAVKRNTLVILPTGLGKTVIALLVAAERSLRARGKIVILAPTKPLVEQHATFLREAFLRGPVAIFTGETPPEDRELAWREAEVIASTPQVVQNDLIAGRISLADVALVVFDEAHRATGGYAYGFIAERYHDERPDGLALGITASPGADAQKIQDVCAALGIRGVEARTESDPDTAPYLQDVGVEWKEVAVPETVRQISALLNEMLDERMQGLRATGAYRLPYVSKKELLATAGRVQAQLKQPDLPNASDLYRALSLQAAALKVSHAVELAETQGLGALAHYLDKLASDESKAAKAILADARLLEVRRLADERKVEHPKLRQVAVILRQEMARKPDAKCLVFTNYRDTAEVLVRELAKVDGLRPAKFTGQASRGEDDRGLSQKKQIEMLDRFKAGEHNVLVATSVAEEGLDIPAMDLVVMYEPVASEIRSIQRRGRTGRNRAGRVVVLITKGTHDEIYHWAGRAKEKKMRAEIQKLKQIGAFGAVNASESSREWEGMFRAAGDPQARFVAPRTALPTAPPPNPLVNREPPLGTFASASERAKPEKAVVVVDHREFASAVAKELSRLDVIVRPESLAVADYVLSDRIAVERKETDDFASSLIDGRLFAQARALRDSYSGALFVVEGENLFTARKISADAIYSTIASLAAEFRVTVLHTKDARETAVLLAAIAKREQLKEKRAIALRSEKGAMSDDERLRFIVEGLPGVSAVLARRLLAKFGSIRELARASIDELREVDGVGEVTAAEIHRVLNSVYSTAE